MFRLNTELYCIYSKASNINYRYKVKLYFFIEVTLSKHIIQINQLLKKRAFINKITVHYNKKEERNIQINF